MKTLLKFLTLLLIVNFFTGCTPKLKALLNATCPSAISTGSTYDNDNPIEEDVLLTKAKSTRENKDNKFFLSYSVGAGVNLPIAERLSLESGLLLSGKGNKTKTGTGNSTFETKLKLNYIDIPLLARYELGAGGFNVFGGLQPSILLSAKNKFETNGNSETVNVKDQYKTLDVAASIGVGYNFDNGIGLNLGYDHGLTKINNSEHSLDIKNRMLKLGISYVILK